MVSSTSPDENCSDNIEEGPLAAASLLPSTSPTATLSSGAGLEPIGDDDDESPLLTNMLEEIIMSDYEVGGEPSANRTNCIPTSTPPPVAGIEPIEIAYDDDNGPELPPYTMPAATLEMEEAGSYSKKMPSVIEIVDDGDSVPELSPSMMPAATLEMEEAGSYSEKMASASNFKGEIIDDDEDAIGENVDIIDPIDVDDDGLAAKRKSEDSGCNPKRRTTESNTQDKTIDNGDDSTRAYVCGITDFPSGRTGDADNWEQYPANPALISTAAVHRTLTLPGATRVPGIFPDDEAGIDVESSGVTACIIVPFAMPVTVMTRMGHDDDDNFIIASRLEPWFKRRGMRQLLVTLLIVVAGSAIAYVVIIRKSAFDSTPIGVNSTRYACVANIDCDDGIWCDGMCFISGNLSSYVRK